MEPAILDSDYRFLDRRGNLLRSRTELSISRMLDFLGKEYEYDSQVAPGMRVDFATDAGLIEVIDGEADLAKYERMRSELPDANLMAIGSAKYASRVKDLQEMAFYDRADPQTGSIFLESESFSFDYAHILPLVEKCSILHGHTSSVMVELAGQMRDNLLVDFGDAKRIIQGVIARFDHKFFINEGYVEDVGGGRLKVGIEGPRGAFDLEVPADTTYMLNGEATVENLATEMIRLLAPLFPPNVEAVGVYIYEGYNKGSHIISRLAER